MVRAAVLLSSLLLIGAAAGLAVPNVGDGVRSAKAQDWTAKSAKKKDSQRTKEGGEGGGPCATFAKANKCPARKDKRYGCVCASQ